MLWQPVYSMDESIYHPPAGGYAGKGEDPRETLCNIGPHNQLFSDLLHGGLLVMIPTLLLLFAPLTIFCINVYSRSARVHLACSLGIVLTLYFAVFCLSHSPFGLKLFWSFYGFMIAALSAQVLSAQDEKNLLKHPAPSEA